MKMLKLSESEVHIWFSLTNEIKNRALLKKFKSLLSEEETKKFKNFFYQLDSHQYLASRVLLRTVLSKYASISPKNWQFFTNDHGKPYIDSSAQNTKQLSFNITHTEGLVMIGITKRADIGVDSEKLIEKLDIFDIAYDNFAKNEVRFMKTLSINERYNFFYKYWTLKEAYLKAKGIGLTRPLNQFSFTFEKNRIICDFAEDSKDCSSRWKFIQFIPSENYISSICVRSDQSTPLRLCIRRTIPFVYERNINANEILVS